MRRLAFFASLFPRANALLYNLTADPYELIDLSTDPAYSDISTLLQSQLTSFAFQNGAPVLQNTELAGGVFKIAGGVVPFLDYYNNQPPEAIIRSGQANAVAPNLVFVILDDLGWNDFSTLSTPSTWMIPTPNIAHLVSNGIELHQHYTAWICAPTRASLFTGIYAGKLGYSECPMENELKVGEIICPLGQSLLSEELQLLGYRTVIIGKWHLGYQSWAYTPTYRGFNYFYGFYNAMVGYYDKLTQAGFFDLQEDMALVTDPAAISSSTHITELLQAKATLAIASHAAEYSHQPLFMYYALENSHADGSDTDFLAPTNYLDQCGGDAASTPALKAYCALVIMADEAIGNTVCALEATSLADNMLMIVSLGDNGGWGSIRGSNYPYRGAKGSLFQGGVLTRAFLYGSLVPEKRVGSIYNGLVHITDWFPGLLMLASNGTWSGPYSGVSIDGINVLPAILTGSPSPRSAIYHNSIPSSGVGAMQIGGMKLINGVIQGAKQTPVGSFSLNGTSGLASCRARQ